MGLGVRLTNPVIPVANVPAGALSSNSSNSLSVTTPSPPHSALQRLAAPRPSRIMRHASSDPEDDHTPAPDSDDGEDLLSMNMGSLRGSMAKFGGRRNGRHSVAAGEIAPGATTLTLKEQEKVRLAISTLKLAILTVGSCSTLPRSRILAFKWRTISLKSAFLISPLNTCMPPSRRMRHSKPS